MVLFFNGEGIERIGKRGVERNFQVCMQELNGSKSTDEMSKLAQTELETGGT